MPRRRTGTVVWRDGQWKAQVTLRKVPGEKTPRVWIALGADITEEQARAKALRHSETAKTRSATTRAAVTGETAREWFEKWCKARDARGLHTVRNDRSRIDNHVLPLLGDTPMAGVTTEQIEDVRDALDARIRANTLSWKTAANVWALITSAFEDASAAKDRSLRVRKDNPALTVKAPDRGARRSKQFLYPSEFLSLVSCEAVPVEYRIVYAAAVYLFARAGELEAMECEDVDVVHGVAHIHRAVDYDSGRVVEVKSDEARRFSIEPTVLPMLRRLIEARGKKGGRIFQPFPPKKDHAESLRAHLLLAGVTRAELFVTDATRKQLTFHDLRATGITWCVVRGDNSIAIEERAGHRHAQSTRVYVRRMRAMGEGFGHVFPALPDSLRQSHRTPGGRKRKPRVVAGFPLCEEGDLNTNATNASECVPVNSHDSIANDPTTQANELRSIPPGAIHGANEERLLQALASADDATLREVRRLLGLD